MFRPTISSLRRIAPQSRPVSLALRQIRGVGDNVSFMWFSPFRTVDLAIDLGTANTVVYVERQGVVLSEPSVVALEIIDGVSRVRATGDDAKLMLGKTPDNVRTLRPLRSGVVADIDVAEQMLRHFVEKVQGAKRWGRAGPQMVNCAPLWIYDCGTPRYPRCREQRRGQPCPPDPRTDADCDRHRPAGQPAYGIDGCRYWRGHPLLRRRSRYKQDNEQVFTRGSRPCGAARRFKQPRWKTDVSAP